MQIWSAEHAQNLSATVTASNTSQKFCAILFAGLMAFGGISQAASTSQPTGFAHTGPVDPVDPSVGGQVMPPLPVGVHAANAFYPAEAQHNNQEGNVFVNFLVHKDGSVSDVIIARTSNFPILDSAAAAAVLTWRYEPATQNGTPIEYRVTAQVQFSLGLDQERDIMDAPSDAWPADALAAELQGAVVVATAIGPDGTVISATVAASSGVQSLDDASVKLVQHRWRFTAARINGNLTRSLLMIKVIWSHPSNPANGHPN